MAVYLQDTPLDPWDALHRYQAKVVGARRDVGATATFVGTMRDFNDDRPVFGMTLEHYPEMTQRYLQRLCEMAAARWQIHDSLIVHRYGELSPGDPIVLVAVWAAHRGDALDACRFLIEELKAKAPFWKRERLEHGTRWVEKNSGGYGAGGR